MNDFDTTRHHIATAADEAMEAVGRARRQMDEAVDTIASAVNPLGELAYTSPVSEDAAYLSNAATARLDEAEEQMVAALAALRAAQKAAITASAHVVAAQQG